MLERARPEDRGANFGRVASGYKNPPYLVTGIQASAFNEVQTDPSLPSANLKANQLSSLVGNYLLPTLGRPRKPGRPRCRLIFSGCGKTRAH